MQTNHQPNLKARGSKKAFIFGPFIGDLYWETFRFAPYAISLKKRFPKHHLIVFTRPRSFDLYGQYASILIPLKIKDGMYVEQGFKLKAYPVSEYKALCRYIKRSYSSIYEISDHYAPQIEGFMYKVKWQYPRIYMDYDFRPRRENYKVIKELYEDMDNIVISSNEDVVLQNYNLITQEQFFKDISEYCKSSSISWLGCLIILIRKSKFIISNFEENLAKFSVLLGTPVIDVNEKLTDDSISLLNPLKTKIIKCNNYEEGIEQYENNI